MTWWCIGVAWTECGGRRGGLYGFFDFVILLSMVKFGVKGTTRFEDVSLQEGGEASTNQGKEGGKGGGTGGGEGESTRRY